MEPAKADYAFERCVAEHARSAEDGGVLVYGAGGTKVQGFIIRPPGFDETKKYPVKFLIHGGPQGAWGDAWSYRWNAELIAANGYVVVMINPRGSTGYGQAFVDGVNGDWGGKPYVDLMTGLDYAEQQYPFIDKTRECALGASYGGYMANWMLTHTNRFKCIVTHDGMFNPQSRVRDDRGAVVQRVGVPRASRGDCGEGTPARTAEPSRRSRGTTSTSRRRRIRFASGRR